MFIHFLPKFIPKMGSTCCQYAKDLHLNKRFEAAVFCFCRCMPKITWTKHLSKEEVLRKLESKRKQKCHLRKESSNLTSQIANVVFLETKQDAKRENWYRKYKLKKKNCLLLKIQSDTQPDFYRPANDYRYLHLDPSKN